MFIFPKVNSPRGNSETGILIPVAFVDVSSLAQLWAINILRFRCRGVTSDAVGHVMPTFQPLVLLEDMFFRQNEVISIAATEDQLEN